MSINKFYPAISEIISTDSIPSSLGNVKDGIQNIFNKIFYKDLFISKSPSGDNMYFKITLISYNKIGFEIPGTGMTIIFNPNDTPESITPIEVAG